MVVPEGKIQYSFSYDDWFNMKELSGRRISYNGPVEEDVIDIIVSHILRFNAEDKGKPVADRQPIFIYVNSPGGDIESGYSAIDSISQSITPVYTVCVGSAMSMAFHIMLAGHKRFSLPNSTFLMHDGSVGFFDSTAKAKDLISFQTDQTEERIKKYVLEHTKISEDKYNAMYRKEWYMYPQEAKELGVIDYIVGEDCTLDDII